jgi:hypothetical protein
VKKSLIHDVDGVIQITPVAISHALNVTGPIFVRPFRGSKVSGSSPPFTGVGINSGVKLDLLPQMGEQVKRL